MESNGKIRVLQAIRQGLIGGGESHVLSLVAALDKERFDPVVLSFTDGPMIDRLREMGVTYHVIPSMRAFDPSTWKAVKRLIEEERIDIVHSHGSRAASNLLLPARWSKRPMIYTIHGWSFHDDQPVLQKTMRIWSERVLTSASAANIAVSASNRDTGVRHFPGFKADVVNNGIDRKRFDPQGHFPDVRKELGIAADKTVVGFIARMTIQKDPQTLLRAFAELLRTQRDVVLLMVGEGELKEEAVALAKQLGIENEVVFQPFRTDVPALLHAMDIYCLPSLWEGLPIGLLEAMAMGKAVVATATDGTKEIVRHGENGCIVPEKDPVALAAAIAALHLSPDEMARLQHAARATVDRQFSQESMTRQIEDIYSRIISKQPSNYHERHNA
ncbi:glycosyltransferase family 4 protein [Chitinophaga pollutisoli]|uniref:Glycosyltransferase family 4 protein n=1 Tax=Chitinophaga pollutisoli TaxID=3133966 RepID=A0ABZ2YPM5_9BACT